MGKKKAPEINASSMADIAFLLLLFFLVTTTIDTDKGMLVRLPQWVEPEDLPPPEDANRRNVLQILVNQYDQLLVNSELVTIDELKRKTKEFIVNNGDGSCTHCKGGKRLPNLSDNPKDAIVSLKNDRATSYEMYISVYNELQAAYTELRDDYSQTAYGKSYDELTDPDARDLVRTELFPMRISEAEPESYGPQKK
jgi:biopolymer transport protein ExbD